MKWTDALSNFSLQVIGKRTIPLSCVIRKTVVAPDPAPLLIPNKPYANEFGSVEEDLIACATHTHPLYCDDNDSLYLYFEEATCSTMYTNSIPPYSRQQDRCGEWLVITCGETNSRNNRISFTTTSVKVSPIFRWTSLSPSIVTPSSQCNSAMFTSISIKRSIFSCHIHIGNHRYN